MNPSVVFVITMAMLLGAYVWIASMGGPLSAVCIVLAMACVLRLLDSLFGTRRTP